MIRTNCMDAMRPNIPDLDEVKQLLTQASAEHPDGDRYIRAATACQGIGISQSLGHYWARKGLVRSIKIRIPSRPGAVRGEVVAWRLDDTLKQARRYWSGGRAWSASEDDFLLCRLGRVPVASAAEQLGRTVRSVRQRATELGINARNAQGEMTTIQVAQLIGVAYCTVIRWCDEVSPPLGHRRMPDRLRSRMISSDHLRAFFEQHPKFYDRRCDAAKRRIDRVTMKLHERRKTVSV